MKIYIKPVLIGILGIVILCGLGFLGYSLYQDYLASQNVEVQVDLTSIYEDATDDSMVTFYNGEQITDTQSTKYIDGILYLPVDMVTEYIDDGFYYDSDEETLTYTTKKDIIRMKTGELSYTLNDEPIQLDIGLTEYDGTAYIPLSLLQKFSHHDYLHDATYHTLQIQDWYTDYQQGIVYYDDSDEENQNVYIRTAADEEATYIYEAYVGMKIHIIGDDGDYYELLTDEGFVGYISKNYVRSVTTLHSNKESIISNARTSFPSTDFDGKVNLVWHQVFNMDANLLVQDKFENVEGVNVISPTWFELSGTDGDVSSLADLDYVRWAHENGMQVWALFSNLGSGYTQEMTHEVLSSTEKRMEVIEKLLAYASVYELDGINIDLESIPEEDGENYVEFVKELSVYLNQAGLVASADVPVPKSWTSYMERGEIAEYLDYLIIMGYDEHWGSSPESGSVASIDFVTEGVENTIYDEGVPSEKIILGVPFYTRLWAEETDENGEVSVSSSAYSMDSAAELMDEKDVDLEWLDDIGQYYGEYTEDDVRYRMWLEDDRSLDLKLQLLDTDDLAGVAGWKLGLESDSVWDVISPYLEK